ncbi:hypothetical protein [Siccirubricoccus sp. G192]|uniref:hypothetical protein n=1 Tax=Siccirubricoccus sp. G192 TaxID=2849651 RepID=UPI001C2BAE5D|nr:hypothetical protein [Siccirubricoccus sp. G192]MBV1799816.1 hypothetical protein [Siccirubricoccus sp. G192]
MVIDKRSARLLLFPTLYFSVAMQSEALPSSCSATNENGGVCSVDCPEGQVASCQNASGGGNPECACTGSFASGATILQNFLRSNTATVANPTLAALPAANSDQQVVVNVRGEVTRALNQLGDRRIKQETRQVPTGRYECRSYGPRDPDGNRPERCWEITHPEQYDVVGRLALNGEIILTTPPQVTLDQPNWSALPISYVGMRGFYRNCTSLQQSFSFAHTEEVTVGQRVTKLTSIVTGTTQKVTASVNVSAPAVPGGIGGGAGIGVESGFTQTITVSDTAEENYTTRRSVQETYPIQVAPNSLVTVTHRWLVRRISVPYSGSVVVDAPIIPNMAGPSGNNLPFLSQILPDPSQRRYIFNGRIEDTTLYDTGFMVTQASLTPDECASSTSSVRYEPFVESGTVSFQ